MENNPRSGSAIESVFKIRASASGSIMGKKGLGKTGESYCETWLKEQIFSRRKEFGNKYTEKGLITEDNSIDFAAEMLGYGFLMKNEQFFENEFFTGTPDVILKDEVLDLKNSWDCFTFPYFEKECPNSDYYWQAQVYMALTGRHKYKLIYTLSDTPEHLIEREARNYCYKNGYEELDEDIYLQFVEKMTYPNIPDHQKIKVFEISKNEEDIALIIDRVKECREFINKLF